METQNGEQIMVTKDSVALRRGRARPVFVSLLGTTVSVVNRVNALDAKALRKAGRAIDARADATLADLRRAIAYVAILAWYTAKGKEAPTSVVVRASAALTGVR